MAYTNSICMGHKPQDKRINRRAIPFVVAPRFAIVRFIRRHGWKLVALYVAQDLVIGVALGVAQYLGYVPQFPFLS